MIYEFENLETMDYLIYRIYSLLGYLFYLNYYALVVIKNNQKASFEFFLNQIWVEFVNNF